MVRDWLDVQSDEFRPPFTAEEIFQKQLLWVNARFGRCMLFVEGRWISCTSEELFRHYSPKRRIEAVIRSKAPRMPVVRPVIRRRGRGAVVLAEPREPR